MSCGITTKFTVSSMRVMKEVLEKLGHSFTEAKGKLVIARKYNNIVIKEETFDYDFDDVGMVEKIKYEYTKSVALETLENRGELYQVQETNSELIVTVN